jgi:RAS protein activator-like 2
LSEDYQILVDVLEPLVSVKAKEEVATSLVHVFQRLNKVKDFLTNIVMVEIDRLGEEKYIINSLTISTPDFSRRPQISADDPRFEQTISSAPIFSKTKVWIGKY